jgi:hypothetical protein
VNSPHDQHKPAADHGHRHDHDHDQQQGHAHADNHKYAAGIRGFLYRLFVPHTHDPHDAIDDALDTSAAGIRAVKISLLGWP